MKTNKSIKASIDVNDAYSVESQTKERGRERDRQKKEKTSISHTHENIYIYIYLDEIDLYVWNERSFVASFIHKQTVKHNMRPNSMNVSLELISALLNFHRQQKERARSQTECYADSTNELSNIIESISKYWITSEMCLLTVKIAASLTLGDDWCENWAKQNVQTAVQLKKKDSMQKWSVLMFY